MLAGRAKIKDRCQPNQHLTKKSRKLCFAEFLFLSEKIATERHFDLKHRSVLKLFHFKFFLFPIFQRSIWFKLVTWRSFSFSFTALFRFYGWSIYIRFNMTIEIELLTYHSPSSGRPFLSSLPIGTCVPSRYVSVLSYPFLCYPNTSLPCHWTVPPFII